MEDITTKGQNYQSNLSDKTVVFGNVTDGLRQMGSITF